MRHAKSGGAIVYPPVQVDGGGDFRGQAAIGIDVGRIQADELGRIALQAPYIVQEQVGVTALGLCKHVFTRLYVHQALVNMHGAAGFRLHRLGHEGRIHAVLVGGLANGALEGKHLVRQAQRIAVEEVDLHLGGTALVNEGIYLQLLGVGVIVHVLNEVLELGHSIDAVGQPRGLRATGAALGRRQLVVGIEVLTHQVELHLRRDHWPQPVGLEQFQHLAQDVASGQGVRPAVHGVAVVNDLGGGFARPGDHAHGARIGHENHVGIGRLDETPVLVGILAGYTLDHDAFGKAGMPPAEKLVGRNELAARIARHIGNQALHFGNLVPFQPFLYGLGIRVHTSLW